MDGAIIHLTIPLINLGGIMDLHRVHSLPLKVKDGYSVTADVDTEYLVTDSSREYFLELKKEDFQVCHLSINFFLKAWGSDKAHPPFLYQLERCVF